MSILIIFENKNPQPWKKILKEKLPNTTVEIYPDVKDKSDIDFAICWKPKNNVFAQFPNLKVAQSVGAAIDHITNSQTIDDHITVTRIIDKQLSSDMWEFLISIVISQIKNIPLYAEQQKSKTWRQHEYLSIHGTTISILGLGKIGGFVAENFAKMGFKVNGWSNSKKEITNVKSYTGKEELDIFLSQSNFLINLLPLTNETENIINKNMLKKLPKGSFFINVGRGEHLIEKDLLELLDNSHLSGALLDVFREEPLPNNHPFWQHPKIQITPHIASTTNVENAISQIVNNYERFTKNKELLNIVSLNKGY